MSGDRTQHVLDAIDGALDDWSVSEDAMRWTPEPKPQPSLALGPGILSWSATPLNPGEVNRLNATFSYLARVNAAAFGRMAVAVGQAVESFAVAINHEPENDAAWPDVPIDDTAWLGSDQEPEPPPRTDVRAHALWRAQHRHTGPQRPTAGQSKRPRRP